MAAVVRMSDDIAQRVQAQALAIEQFISGPCSVSCAAFAGSWSALRPYRAALPAALVRDCDALASQIRDFARVAAGLQRGKYELCAVQAAPGDIRIGVVQAGSVPGESDVGWALLPVLVISVVAVGVWILVDLYLRARQLEAQAQSKRAELQLQMANAIAAAPPDQRAQLAAAMQRANNSAAPQDWLTRVGTALTDAGSKIAAGAESWLPWALLAAVVFLSARGRR